MARGGNKRHHERRQRGAGKRARHAAAEDQPTAPSAAFLAALEAQRAKQHAEQERGRRRAAAGETAAVRPEQPTTRDATTAERSRQDSPARTPLPGFYYDEAKGKYFKLTKQQQRRGHTADTEQRPRHAVAVAGSHRRRRGWIGYLAEREWLAAGAVQHRDHRELMPRFYAARLSKKTLVQTSVSIDTSRDRFSAVDVSADSSTVYLGYASGYVRSFAIPSEPGRSKGSFFERGSVDTGGLMISCIRRHQQSHGVLVSAVDARVDGQLASLHVRGGSGQARGRVGLFGDPTFRHQPFVWQLCDPWVTEWCPHQMGIFSVGLGAQQGAALVDCSAPHDGQVAMMAPSGRIKSDTLSQTFSQHTSSIIVNGARNGSWWTWDTRAPRRAAEVRGGKASGCSMLSMRLLRDECRLVTQRSNGELQVLDLRSPTQSPVLQVCTAEHGAYKSMLHFDMDDNETVIAAATNGSVCLFDVTRGIELSKLPEANRPDATTSIGQLSVEKVILTHTQGDPNVWGLSRSALYFSA